jgi:uncharacterized protein (DUF362 family)
MINRREFLQTGISLLTFPVFLKKQSSSRVVKVTYTSPLKKGKIEPKIADLLVQKAICTLAGKSKPVDAWRQYISPQDKIAIKINCLGGKGIATSKSVVKAIIQGLKLAGIKEERITIYDQFRGYMSKAGFRPIQTSGKVRIVYHEMTGYGEKIFRIRGLPFRFCKTLLESTAVINVPVLKSHSLCGITCALKNMSYGSIDVPHRFHRQRCDPFISEIYALPEIRKKVRLIIADGLRVLYHRGPHDNPKFKADYKAIFCSIDPVSIDRICMEVINSLRQKKGLIPLHKSKKNPTYIHTANQIGLGIDDLSRINLIQVSL